MICLLLFHHVRAPALISGWKIMVMIVLAIVTSVYTLKVKGIEA